MQGEPTPASEFTTFPVVGVGASAGGMEAFTELLRLIPPDSGMAFVLVQHLDPTHASYLSEALTRSTTFTVAEIQDGMAVLPDRVYVIPPNADVGIIRGALTLLPRPTQARRPYLPVDFFFKALAADRGHQAIGIVLSGTGSDGAEGLRAIKAEGGVTFAQDPRSAKFSGMPEAAIKTGAVDFALPIPELAPELLRIGHHPFVRVPEADVLGSPVDVSDLKKVLVLIRSAVGVDFSDYKLPSIKRRLARRMALHRLTGLAEYVRLLRDDPAEAPALFDDILIHVTSFFRDGVAFDRLKEHVFPDILKLKRHGGTIRIWCTGCSTGEEAYSILIVLLEFLANEDAADMPIQLFGTDISEKAIDKARAAIYPETIARDVSPERLARFFSKVDGGGYRLNKPVRELCAFVKHDLSSDPPFSRLDLVSCRNVLIYLGHELQKRVLATFHFALHRPGYLLLGHAENIADGAHLFSAIDKEAKIFARSAAKSALRLAPARETFPLAPPPAAVPAAGAAMSADVVRRTEALLLDYYAPPGVIVNERMEILHFRGRTGPYLEPAPGQPQLDLLKMAKKGLVAELRIALSQARKLRTLVRRPGVRVEQDGLTRICDVVVVPLVLAPEPREPVYAVVFEEPRPASVQLDGHAARPATGTAPRPASRAEQRRVDKLEDELKATKEYLQSIIEEHQRTNEELMSANEELVSSNEELQSLNEELETAKEELQSTNEELSTLNEELQTRNLEINAANSDLVNVLGSVEVPIVIVDGQRRIRRVTPKARHILNLLPSDVGRPLDDITPSLAIEKVDQKTAEVIETLAAHEEEARGRDGRWYRLQIRPYTTVDKRIDGAVLSIVDIDVLKRALGAAEFARDYARATVEAVQTPLIVLDEKLRVMTTNEAFHASCGPRAESEGRPFYEIMSGAWDIPRLRTALELVLQENGRFSKLEVEAEIPRLGKRTLSLSGCLVPTPSGERMVLLAVEDITERLEREAERARLLADTEAAKASAEEANRSKDVFLATLSHELRTPLSSLLMQAQLMRIAKLDEQKIRRAAESIERASKAQAQLVDDLLDISRIVTGKLKMEPEAVSLASIVQAAADTVGPLAEKKHLELELDLDESLPPVSADPARLQQAVCNLLVNAIKFTPENGRVSVSVDAVDGSGRVRMRDTGIGIEPSFLPHMFNRFSQGDRGHARTHGGLGLGLAIARYIVEAHGGTIQAESAGKGTGATFTVVLPLMKVRREAGLRPDAEAAAVELAGGTIRGARILIVEDDPGTREALTEMLSLSGAQVSSADSGARAMQLLQELRPELLICDIAMPGEDGYALLRRIRALGRDQGGEVPALALTALASEENRRSASAAGFQAHVAKPIEIDRLIAAIADLLERSVTPANVYERSPGP